MQETSLILSGSTILTSGLDTAEVLDVGSLSEQN